MSSLWYVAVVEMMGVRIPEAVVDQLEELVARIREGKLAIFCGAGISIRPPSNLPSARSLREAILECLIDVSTLDDKVRKRLIEGMIAEGENGGSTNKGRPRMRGSRSRISLMGPHLFFLRVLVSYSPTTPTF